MPKSSELATKDNILPSQYNNLRDDAIGTVDGHRHTGANDPSQTSFDGAQLTGSAFPDGELTTTQLADRDRFISGVTFGFYSSGYQEGYDGPAIYLGQSNNRSARFTIAKPSDYRGTPYIGVVLIPGSAPTSGTARFYFLATAARSGWQHNTISMTPNRFEIGSPVAGQCYFFEADLPMYLPSNGIIDLQIYRGWSTQADTFPGSVWVAAIYFGYRSDS